MYQKHYFKMLQLPGKIYQITGAIKKYDLQTNKPGSILQLVFVFLFLHDTCIQKTKTVGHSTVSINSQNAIFKLTPLLEQDLVVLASYGNQFLLKIFVVHIPGNIKNSNYDCCGKSLTYATVMEPVNGGLGEYCESLAYSISQQIMRLLSAITADLKGTFEGHHKSDYNDLTLAGVLQTTQWVSVITAITAYGSRVSQPRGPT